MAEGSDRSDTAQAHQLAELHHILPTGAGVAVKPGETRVAGEAAVSRVARVAMVTGEARVATAAVAELAFAGAWRTECRAEGA